MTWTPPLGTLAICRMAATAPIFFRSAGSVSSRSCDCSVRNMSRSPASARLIDSIDNGRVIASGCSVSGNTTVCRSARTGSSDGYVRTGSFGIDRRL
jgi:hypothetical protein